MRALPVVLCAVLLPALAHGEQQVTATPPGRAPPGDLGLHLEVGGALPTAASRPGLALSVTRVTVPVSFSFRVAVGEHWTLAADAWGAAAPAPKSIVPGSTLAASGLGLNLIHQVRPASLFVSFSPSTTLLTVLDDGGSILARTQLGFGAKLAVGKEWRVGGRWALGLAAEALVVTHPEQCRGAPTWLTFAGGVAFSATDN